MIVSSQIPFHRPILSLSEALDHVHPSITDHQHRGTFIGMTVARQLDLRTNEQRNLFNAAAFHDIGLIYAESRVSALVVKDFEKVPWHPEAGFEFLKHIPGFRRAASILRHHHMSWSEARKDENRGRGIPISSHILTLADSVELAIDRESHILEQRKSIEERIVRAQHKHLSSTRPPSRYPDTHIARPSSLGSL